MLEDEKLEELEELEEEYDRGDLVEDDLEEDDSEEVEDDSEPEEIEDDDSEEVEDDSEPEEIEDIQIPKSRLDEVIAQREASKDRVQWLEDQLETLINQKQVPVPDSTAPVKDPYDYNKAENEYIELLIDGESAKAAALRATIDAERKLEFSEMIRSIKEESVTEATSKSNEVVEQNKFNSLITNFENKHPFLDADSTDYNEEAVETVNTLLSGYMSSGKTKSEALHLSIKKVVPMYEDLTPKKKSLGDTRKSTARRKAAKASNAQPTRTTSRGVSKVDPETVDLSTMSERNYDKLTTKEKRILRGD